MQTREQRVEQSDAVARLAAQRARELANVEQARAARDAEEAATRQATRAAREEAMLARTRELLDMPTRQAVAAVQSDMRERNAQWAMARENAQRPHMDKVKGKPARLGQYAQSFQPSVRVAFVEAESSTETHYVSPVFDARGIQGRNLRAYTEQWDNPKWERPTQKPGEDRAYSRALGYKSWKDRSTVRDVNKTTVCGLEVTREHVTGYARQTETATTEDVIVKRTSRSGQDYTEWAAVPIMEAPLRETVRAITCAPCRQAYERDTYGRASR